MNLNKYQYRVNSKHSLMTNFICFNSTRDKFITCGEDGELNIYKIDEDNKIIKLAYYKVFQKEVIVDIKWALPSAGGFIGIAGSKGTLVILSLDNSNGQITENGSLSFPDVNLTNIEWHPTRRLLLCGTHMNSIICINQFGSLWNRQKMITPGESMNNPIYVCWGNQQIFLAFFARDDALYHAKNITQWDNSTTFVRYFGEYDKLPADCKLQRAQYLQQNQQILRVLCRNQIYKATDLQLIILSDRSILILRVTLPTFHRLLQKINLEINEFFTMSWGRNQNQIGLYSHKKFDTSKQKFQISDVMTTPKAIRKKINGKWQYIK